MSGDRPEFVILGSGTSAGVPLIGCDCRTCRSPDPRDRRTRPGACLRFEDAGGQERVILIDATPDLREQVLSLDLRRLDGILLTHSHVDHVFGLDDVRRFNALTGEPIDLHGEPSTLEDVARVFQHIFAPELSVNRSWVARLEPRPIEVARPLDLHGMRFTPVRLWHGNLPVVGFRIEALDPDGKVADRQPRPLPIAYLTDVSRIPEETWAHLEGLDTLVLDMLRPRPHPTHLSRDQAVEIARRIGARRTWFTHMTHDILHAEIDAGLPEGMTLSHDGLRLE